MVNVRKRKERRSRGNTAAEAAIVLPVILMVTFGAIKYGWLFLKAQQITNAARMGARIGVLPDSTVDKINTEVRNLMTAANINPDDCTVIITPEDIGSLEVGESLTVRVIVPHDKVDIMPVPLLTKLEPSDWNLGAEVTMAKEGF